MVELVKQGADRLSIAGLTGATAASRYVGATASGVPASGTFAIGDFIIDQTGQVHVCTVAGTPGTWTNSGSAGIVDAGGPVTINKIWSGSQAQYDALGTYDADTLYFTPEA